MNFTFTSKVSKLISTITCEKNFEDIIHGLIKDIGGDSHHHVDNDNGVPDISFGIGGVNGFAEVKYGCSRHAKLRPSQAKWMAKRALTGGNCWIIWLTWKEKKPQDRYIILFNYQTLKKEILKGVSLTNLAYLLNSLIQGSPPPSRNQRSDSLIRDPETPPLLQVVQYSRSQYRTRRTLILADLSRDL